MEYSDIIADAFASSNFIENFWNIAFYGVLFHLSSNIVNMFISNLLGEISTRAKASFDLIDVFSSIYYR